MGVIVPGDTLEIHGGQLSRADYYSNFSLLFRNYVPWRDEDCKFPPNQWNNFEQFRFDEEILERLIQRGKATLQAFARLGLPAVQFTMHTSWRVITGIGASSSLEVGMILHHVYGIPYIPASSIKGLLRYYLNKVDAFGLDIDDLFGKSEDNSAAKGKIVFLDAFPEPGFRISVDIMNNHYQKYYMGEGDIPPADWMDPNPVKFLTVKDATFVFRLFANDDSVSKDTLSTVSKALSQALIDLGIGAKTAVGYGRLENFQALDISTQVSSAASEEGDSEQGTEDEFFFYADPDGTKEYYLIRIEQIAPYSKEVEWLFHKWERDEQWKNDPDIARAFLPKIKRKKKSGKETHFYKVIKRILGEAS